MCRGGRLRLSCRSRRRWSDTAVVRRSIKLAIISGKFGELHVKPVNSYLLPVYFLSTWARSSCSLVRAHAKLHRHGVEITLNTPRHQSCPTASQCRTATDMMEHEASGPCFVFKVTNTVRAQVPGFLGTRNTGRLHGTNTTLLINL